MHVALHVDRAHPAPLLCSLLSHSRARPAPRSQRHLPARLSCGWPQEWVGQPESFLRQRAGSPPPCKHSRCQDRACELVTSGASRMNLSTSRRKRQGNYQIKETTKPVSASPHPLHLWMGSIGNQISCTHTAYRKARMGPYHLLPRQACLYLPELSPTPSSM